VSIVKYRLLYLLRPTVVKLAGTQSALGAHFVFFQRWTTSSSTPHAASACSPAASSNTSGMSRIKLLGEGSFGSVFLVREKKPNGRLVCAKVLRHVHVPSNRPANAGSWSVEASVMRKLRHPNLIRLLASSKQLIIMDYCSGGDLRSHLRVISSRGRTSEDKIWFWFVQLALALHHMHALRILHRDVKTANVFLSNDGFLVLGDLGIARDLGGATDDVAATIIGTPLYMAPEMFEGKTYTFSSDVWALGCVLYELCAGAPPFTGTSTPHLMRKICSGKYPALPASCSSAIVRLVGAMLAFYPDQRPTMDAVLRDPSLRIHLERYAADRLGSRSSGGDNNMERQVLADQLARLGVQDQRTAKSTSTESPIVMEQTGNHPASALGLKGVVAAVDDALEKQLMAIREQERQDQLRFALKKLQEMRLQHEPEGRAAVAGEEPQDKGRSSPDTAAANRQHLPDIGVRGDDVQWKAPVNVECSPSSFGRERRASSGEGKDDVLQFRGIPRAGVPLTTRAKVFATKSLVCRDVRELRKHEAAKAAQRYRRDLDERHGPRRHKPEKEVRSGVADVKNDKETDGAILQAMADLQRFIQAGK
jgi:serine/threonine protein kinase